jgi:hypothetical protein
LNHYFWFLGVVGISSDAMDKLCTFPKAFKPTLVLFKPCSLSGASEYATH